MFHKSPFYRHRSNSDDFNEAATPTEIENGFDYITGSIIPRSDVTIFSDVNHGENTTIYQNMLSPELLEQYAKSGVTNILVEGLEKHDIYAKDLFEGKIERQDFIDAIMEGSYSPHMTEAEHKASTEALADAIIAGSKQNPPIRIYLSLIENTEEQRLTLFDLELQELSASLEIKDKINDFITSLEESGIHLSEEDKEELREIKLNLGKKEGYSATDVAFEILGDKIDSEQINSFLSDIYDIAIKKAEIGKERTRLKNQYRTDNDGILADRVVEAKKENNNGKTIVIHGAGHGASSNNDLDDQLQERGLTVSRINIAHNEEALENIKDLEDPSELSYFPESDKVEIKDANRDGVVTGLYDEKLPYSQVPNPQAPPQGAGTSAP